MGKLRMIGFPISEASKRIKNELENLRYLPQVAKTAPNAKVRNNNIRFLRKKYANFSKDEINELERRFKIDMSHGDYASIGRRTPRPGTISTSRKRTTTARKTTARKTRTRRK